MAEKKWSDYWKKYGSKERIPSKTERPTITIAPRIPSVKGPGVNRSVFLLILFLVTIAGLSYFNFKSTSLIKVLETNKTYLENQLASCQNDTQSLNADLGTCNADLGTCEGSLSSKTNALNTCQNQKSTISSDLEDCRDEVKICSSDYKMLKSDYDDLEDDYSSCKNSLSGKEDDLNECRDDYNQLRDNLRDHAAKDKCCETANNQTYSIDNNDVTCYADDSGEYSLSC